MSRRVEDQLGASLDAASAIFNRPARKQVKLGCLTGIRLQVLPGTESFGVLAHLGVFTQAARPALYDDAAGGDYNIWCAAMGTRGEVQGRAGRGGRGGRGGRKGEVAGRGDREKGR